MDLNFLTSNKMKLKFSIPGLIAALALVLNGCQKAPAQVLAGSYTFKTSGYVSAQNDSDSNIKNFNVPTDSGQMDIAVVDAQAGQLLVTMNISGGELLVFDGSIEGEEIKLSSITRIVKAESLFSDVSGEFQIEGSGKRYDNIILFDIIYSGRLTSGVDSYTIIGSDVHCRAKRNE